MARKKKYGLPSMIKNGPKGKIGVIYDRNDHKELKVLTMGINARGSRRNGFPDRKRFAETKHRNEEIIPELPGVLKRKYRVNGTTEKTG